MGGSLASDHGAALSQDVTNRASDSDCVSSVSAMEFGDSVIDFIFRESIKSTIILCAVSNYYYKCTKGLRTCKKVTYAKPVPVMVISVPPAVPPLTGETTVTEELREES